MRRTRLTLAVTLVASAAVVGLPTVASAAPEGPAADVPVQLITMNDFHGRISDTTQGDATLTAPDGSTQTVGGSANIASTVASTRAAFVASGGDSGSSYFVGAGDLISASTFESAFYRDEPTVEVLNAMGLDVSSVGNHEFDRGTDELARISGPTDNQYGDRFGACDGRLVVPGVDGCYQDSTGDDFHGTDYPYLAANVLQAGTDEPFLPPYQILDVGGGKRMALIGVVTETTPTIVAPTGIEDVEFIDEAEAINRWVPVLQGMGIEAIGVLIHEGGVNTGADANDPDGCAQITGPIADVNNRTDAAVDFIVSAHTHQNYSCYLADPAGQPRLVTQAGYYGRLVGDLRLVIDGQTGDVDRLCGTYQSTNVPVTRDDPDPDVAAIVGYWNERSAVDGAEVVGTTSAPLGRARTSSGSEDRGSESLLGNTVAEAQLRALAADPATYGDPDAGYAGGAPVLAFMNPGGLRADIDQGDITFREVFDVQPFGNYVNAVTLTGEQIRLVLEQQFPTDARARQLYMGTSEGLTYGYDPTRPAYDRVDPDSIKIEGVPVVSTQTYRVVTNSFLASGGDSFTAFAQGTDAITGPVDVDTFQEFLADNDPAASVTTGHGTPITGGAWPAAVLTPPTGGTTSDDNGADTVAAGVRADGGTAAAGFTCPAAPATGGGPAAPGAPGTQPIANPGNGIAAGQLANTGAATGQLTALGVGLLLAGGVATAAGYRRGRGLTR